MLLLHLPTMGDSGFLCMKMHLFFIKKQGTEIARIARRLGRTPGAASARFSMIYRSYQGYSGTRPPSRLPLQRQE